MTTKTPNDLIEAARLEIRTYERNSNMLMGALLLTVAFSILSWAIAFMLYMHSEKSGINPNSNVVMEREE